MAENDEGVEQICKERICLQVIVFKLERERGGCSENEFINVSVCINNSLNEREEARRRRAVVAE